MREQFDFLFQPDRNDADTGLTLEGRAEYSVDHSTNTVENVRLVELYSAAVFADWFDDGKTAMRLMTFEIDNVPGGGTHTYDLEKYLLPVANKIFRHELEVAAQKSFDRTLERVA
jgi:hypothetical protein